MIDQPKEPKRRLHRVSDKFVSQKGDLHIEWKPECPRCHSSEHVIETFIGPDDPPGMHSYGDVISPGQSFHSHWCTACDAGVGEPSTLPSLPRRHKPKP